VWRSHARRRHSNTKSATMTKKITAQNMVDCCDLSTDHC
jgi:hypothetical protein